MTLTEAANAAMTEIDSLRRLLAERDAEIERLKAGKFTPEEFHNLCHEDKPVSPGEFAEGCMAYQERLYGRSPTRILIQILQRNNNELRAVLEEIHVRACLAECLNCEPAWSSIAKEAAIAFKTKE